VTGPRALLRCRPTAADWVVIAASFALLGALYAAYWQPPEPAGWVEIRAGGDVVGRYDLAVARDVDVEGREGISVIRIESGRARFLHAPCRNQICVHAGWQDHAGDAAACLPNRVSLRLLGGESADAVDGISF